MIKIHHLNNSRSQRILWVLEEMGLEYDVIRYERDGTTNLAPPELLKIHPLGKSPVLEDGDMVLHESAAIVDYLIRSYGNGDFAPDITAKEYTAYMEWMHYAEGSAMTPLLLRLYVSKLGEAGEPLMPRINGETINHFSFMNNALKGHDYFVGNSLTGADIMLSFPLEAVNSRGGLAPLPELSNFVKRIQARPAYLKALEKGGNYAFGPK